MDQIQYPRFHLQWGSTFTQTLFPLKAERKQLNILQLFWSSDERYRSVMCILNLINLHQLKQK